MPVTVVPFAAEHLEPAAILLAARHRADQYRVRGLPPAFADSAVAMPALEALLVAPSTDGWATLTDGRLTGFLVGKRHLFADTTLMASFFDARAVIVPFIGYAAETEMAESLYRALYAAAAARWVEAGFVSHSIRTTADPAGVEPWFSLGFGQRLAGGYRRLDDDPRASAAPPLPPAFSLRRAGPADVDAVHALSTDLMRFHANAPMFLPQSAEAIAAQRDAIVDWLADPAVGYWVAVEGGKVVGAMGLHPAEGFIDDGRRAEHGAYLFLAHMRASARGRGVATALLQATLGWARDTGYAACTVEWFTANPLSSRFWPRRGFVPFTARLERRVDPRVAWAKAGPGT
jgi:GNAT superfamily N-acetyltransferase